MALDAFSRACERVAAQFRLQADSLDLAIVAPMASYKFRVRDERRQGEQSGELLARCLPDTWALYEQRLYKAVGQVGLLIVQSHNAVSPLPVLSLDDGRYHPAGALPAIARTDAQRRNEREKRLLVSALALGLETAESQLAAMSERSRQRYLALLRDCFKPRRGRARML